LKRLEKILVNLVGTVIAMYAVIVLLFSLPFMQQRLAGWTAHLLSKQVKANVEIGSINLGLLNRIIVNDINIATPTDEPLAHIARVSASLNPFALLSGQVNIGTAQLFGVKATLYRETPDSAPNFQFLIDAFKSDDTKEPTELNLRIGSFILRHADVSYDVKSEPTLPNTLDPNHLRLHDCGMNVMLRCLTDDSLNIAIRRLQAKELNTGLAVKETRLKLVANTQCATLSDVHLALPHSHVDIDSLYAHYGNFEHDSTFQFHGSPLSGSIVPKDLALFYQPLATLTDAIPFRLDLEGNDQEVNMKECAIGNEEDGILLRAIGSVTHPLSRNKRDIRTDITTLRISNPTICQLADVFVPDHGKEELLTSLQEVAYKGNLNYAADGSITSQGSLETGLGAADYDLSYDAEQFLAGTVSGDSIQLGKILGGTNDTANPEANGIGTTSFALDIAMNLAKTHPFPAGKVTGEVYSLQYHGYNYQNITVDARSTSNQVEGTASIDDEQVKATADFAYSDTPAKDIQLNLILEQFRPNNLNLTDQYKDEDLSLNAVVQLHGADFQQLYGTVSIQDLHLSTPTDQYDIDHITLQAERTSPQESRYTIGSDILDATIQGDVSLADLAASFSHQLAHHLPALIKSQEATHANFTYDLTLTDAPVLHHFTDTDFELKKPLHLSGDLNGTENLLNLQLSAPCLTYNGKQYDDIAMTCNSTAENMNLHALASTFQESDDDEEPSTSTKVDVTADIHNNRISSDLYMNTDGRNHIILQLLPVIQLSDSLGSMKTDITLRKSSATVNDTTWTVSPAHISLYKKNIECRGVKFANDNTNSFLAINGRASDSPSDSLVATLNNLEIEYILSLVNFTVVRFAGKASGRAVVNNVLGNGEPDIRANLFVENLSVQEGPIGDANITAHWDKEVEGISVEGRIVDLYQVPDGLTGREKNVTGITTVDGWISPARNDIRLDINTLNTNAAFIHGFLGGVFKEVSGYVTGPISIIGPLNDVNIVGDAVPTMNLRLRATNVPYHIEGDTLHIRPYLFDFQNISIYDRFGHRSTINGQVTHRNMKNFAYHFKADLHELLAYDETEFNSDKFLATVFADGNLTIDGSDGHPLYVNASVTPTRGSVFAYDAATPDAITGNSFIEFRDRDSLLTASPHLFDRPSDETEAAPVMKDSLTIVKEAKKNYDSDIFINFDINLTPACEVKLRMDNIEDGYMRTFGNAQLTAKWYNKGSFQLFGNYNINAGSYRLYLQDIIFRDLALQPGSMVEFNGNPFDANIHLICHHTINSVPLSDLTATTAFSQNNKVKVICILDITGKLGNMDFAFDMELPNVNEEVRQLVRSMINSEEEMNTQMIYLLGLGRFYPNEYARANGGDNSSQAVNSLLSSTLSGQINQMLSNVIGNNTNWNFGSSLTTGEKGWDDLDVEGMLEGRLLDERLLINGAFGYRDNALTNHANFIGDFEVKWRMNQKGTLYVKAYNQTNDRYFTKATLNTQGLGLSWRHEFESIRRRMKKKAK